jgi:transcriptional regulator with XRE-family HTH domain
MAVTLQSERQRRGWSRAYIAEHIGVADVKTIGRWERGTSFPSTYFLQRLCELFALSAEDLGLWQRNRATKQQGSQVMSGALASDVLVHRLPENVLGEVQRWTSLLANHEAGVESDLASLETNAAGQAIHAQVGAHEMLLIIDDAQISQGSVAMKIRLSLV